MHFVVRFLAVSPVGADVDDIVLVQDPLLASPSSDVVSFLTTISAWRQVGLLKLTEDWEMASCIRRVNCKKSAKVLHLELRKIQYFDLTE